MDGSDRNLLPQLTPQSKMPIDFIISVGIFAFSAFVGGLREPPGANAPAAPFCVAHFCLIFSCPCPQKILSSISSRRLYFARRSPRAGAPALMYSAFTATARSAMALERVSPLRWETMTA